MTLEQISQIILDESNVFILIDRLVDTSSIPSGEYSYSLDQNLSLDFYDRIIMHESLLKPSLVEFNAELENYKAELTQIENDRLNEIARVEDIKNRFLSLQNIRPILSHLGLDIPNLALELKRIIKEDDQNFLSNLETAAITVDQEIEAQKQLENEMKIADGLIQLCLGCIKIVMKHNIRNSLTKEQKDQQALTYSDAFGALKDWRPGSFKSAITALVPDETLVKQDLKDELISFLEKNGL